MDKPRPPGPPPPPEDRPGPPADHPELPEADPEGPPPPPPAAVLRSTSVPASGRSGPPLGARPPDARPRRRRWPWVAALLVIVLALPLTLLVANLLPWEPEPTAAPDISADDPAAEPEEDNGAPEDGGRDDGGEGSAPVDPDAELEPLDLAELAGRDLVYGRLLTDIDASERAMIDFQEGLADTFSDPDSPESALEGASEVAADSQAALLAVRARLVDAVDDPGAERVRALYVEHLDSWEAFMAAVAEDPLMVFQQSEAGFTVVINATADAFARALEEELPDDADAEVARFAEGILDRGFRGLGYADV